MDIFWNIYTSHDHEIYLLVSIYILGPQVVQAISGNVGGKQLITGMLPGQQVVSVDSLLGHAGKSTSQAGIVTSVSGGKINAANFTSVSGGKIGTGNLIQLAGILFFISKIIIVFY